MNKLSPGIGLFLLGAALGVAATILYFRLTAIPSLTEEFAMRGVTLEKIARLEVEGDEPSRTSGKRVRIEDRETINFIWQRCIQTAAPYEFRIMSGARRLHFYVTDSPDQVAVTLNVNETDYSNLQDSNHGYMCHGLEALLMSYLTDQEKTKQSSNHSLERTPTLRVVAAQFKR